MKNQTFYRDHKREHQEIKPKLPSENPESSGAVLSQDAEILSTLHRLSSTVLTFQKVDELLTEVIMEIQKCLGHKSVMICLVDESGKRLECRAPTEDIQKFWKLRKSTFSMDELKSVLKFGTKISRSYYIQFGNTGEGMNGNAQDEPSAKNFENYQAFHSTSLSLPHHQTTGGAGLVSMRSARRCVSV